MMRSWLFLLLVVPGAMTLQGCDRPGDDMAQAPPRAPVERSELPQTPGERGAARHDEPVTRLAGAGDGNAKEIEWDALIPEDWRPDTPMGDVDIADLSDDDPRAQRYLDELKVLWREAPVVAALEGQQVRLPGFVVPLEMDAKKIDQFLLVPYYGACVHVPPPPANQTVHVVTREGEAFEGQLFDVVWVTGTMRVERLSSDLAEAGYRLEDASVVAFE